MQTHHGEAPNPANVAAVLAPAPAPAAPVSPDGILVNSVPVLPPGPWAIQVPFLSARV